MVSYCTPDFSHRVEHLVVQVDDLETDRDEFEAVIHWNRNTDFLTVKDDSLSLHNQSLARHGRHI